jgi:Peptidase M15
MHKGSIAVLSLLVAAVAPTAVNARSYSDDGYRYSHHARASHRHASGSAGTSTTCLTSAARNLLGRIRNHFGNVEIVSTCRPGAVIAGTRTPSKHASGQAIDFRVPGNFRVRGKKGEVVRWLIANHHTGGVMTYNNMDHIHVDVGPRFVALNRPSGRT